MRPVGRRIGAVLGVLLVPALLAGCGDDADPVRTIALLRAAPASPDEPELLEELARLDYGDDRVRVLPGADVYPDPEAAEAAVRGWVDDEVDVIVALATSSAQAAARVTSTVPIVFFVNDPRVAGLVEDERHPDANLTGSTYRIPADRVLALANDAFGGVQQVGCVHPTADPAVEAVRQDLLRGAAALGMSVRCESFDGPEGAAGAVERLLAGGVDVVVPLSSPRTVQAFPQLAEVLSGAATPVVTTTPWDVATLTLVPDASVVYRQIAGQVARLLEGDPVAAIPVEDPASYRMVLNLRAAERLGLTIPPDIVARADEIVR